MAYIGKQPVVGNFQICDAISVVNGQAAYTMQVGSVNVLPETANHMIVSLNGVIQAPISSYTVSGSTITFASALVTGDSIDFIQILGDVLNIGTPSDGTVTNAKLASGSFSNITDVGTLSSGLTLSDNIVFDTASKGIYLGVTTATAANLLDDYEEGTWTPTFINFSGSGGESQPSVAEGHYTKIGNLVFIGVYLEIPANGDSSSLAVNNIPFTSKDISNNIFGGSVTRTSANISNGVGSFIPENSNIFYVSETNATNLVDYSVFSGKFLSMVATYLTDA